MFFFVNDFNNLRRNISAKRHLQAQCWWPPFSQSHHDKLSLAMCDVTSPMDCPIVSSWIMLSSAPSLPMLRWPQARYYLMGVDPSKNPVAVVRRLHGLLGEAVHEMDTGGFKSSCLKELDPSFNCVGWLKVVNIDLDRAPSFHAGCAQWKTEIACCFPTDRSNDQQCHLLQPCLTKHDTANLCCFLTCTYSSHFSFPILLWNAPGRHWSTQWARNSVSHGSLAWISFL